MFIAARAEPDLHPTFAAVGLLVPAASPLCTEHVRLHNRFLKEIFVVKQSISLLSVSYFNVLLIWA